MENRPRLSSTDGPPALIWREIVLLSTLFPNRQWRPTHHFRGTTERGSNQWPADASEVTVSKITAPTAGFGIVVDDPPGSSDAIHRHKAHAFVYVLEGS
jgi:hypothetical protein